MKAIINLDFKWDGGEYAPGTGEVSLAGTYGWEFSDITNDGIGGINDLEVMAQYF